MKQKMYIENVRSVVLSLNLTQPLTPSLKNQRRGIDPTSKLEIDILVICVLQPLMSSERDSDETKNVY
jgi:hypothetical protein